MKNAFEKSFRNHATKSLAVLVASQVEQDEIESAEVDVDMVVDMVTDKAQDKGKGKAIEDRPVREPSPVWDIERGLSPAQTRAESPVWDIELDLT